MHSAVKGLLIIGIALMGVGSLLYLPSITIGETDFVNLKESLVTIGAILVIPTFGLKLYPRIKRLFNKPKLSYKTSRFTDEVKQYDKYDYLKVTFWIHVQNYGKDTARQCRILMKITDHSGVINIPQTMKIPTVDEWFAVDWANEWKGVLDIIASTDTHYGRFKIPFHGLLAKNYNDVIGNEHMPYSIFAFDDPIRQWNIAATHTSDEQMYHFEIGVRIRILSDTISFPEKTFALRIPPSTIGGVMNPDEIIFEEVNQEE